MTLSDSRSFAAKAASRLRGTTVSGRDRLARASALLLMQAREEHELLLSSSRTRGPQNASCRKARYRHPFDQLTSEP
jgi:hypothetical protein